MSWEPILQAFTNRPPTEDVLSHLWEVIDAEGQRHTIAEGAGVGGAEGSEMLGKFSLRINGLVGRVGYIYIWINDWV